MLKVFFIVIFMILANTSDGLSQNQRAIPIGDTAAAHRSKHHEFTGTHVIAQIGYIDTDKVTVKELWDNLEIGLVAVPRNDYEIVSFTFGLMCKCPDYMGPYDFIGNKIHFATPKETNSFLSIFHSGDRLFFENIRAKRKGSDHTVLLDPVCFQLIE